MPEQAKTRNEQSRTQDTIGLEDLTRSVRGLARSTRNLGEATFDVAERELNMAIRISEQIRDSVVSKDAIEKARKSPIASSVRDDAHRIVDLVADVGIVVAQSAVEFLERFADDRRPPTAKERVEIKEG
ncbi:MAG TPA: hypothetical protein VJZ27_10440 [Aggregatilineales bacterium]|nr:hypothetical protein [Aggregatilineales bacterium]